MSVQAEVYSESPIRTVDLNDPEWRQIAREIDALDQYLRIQNLRRMEEETIIRLIEGRVL